jgi:Arc/MetJ family transcription regulator
LPDARLPGPHLRRAHRRRLRRAAHHPSQDTAGIETRSALSNDGGGGVLQPLPPDTPLSLGIVVTRNLSDRPVELVGARLLRLDPDLELLGFSALPERPDAQGKLPPITALEHPLPGAVPSPTSGRRSVYINFRYAVCMPKRTTIEIDEALLSRAKRALGCATTRATVEEALRRAADQAEDEQAERADRQRRYLAQLSRHADPAVLDSEDMWR